MIGQRSLNQATIDTFNDKNDQPESFRENISFEKPFRPIHYLGSKLRLVENIRCVVDELDPTASCLCDLFAGSGTVSRYLSFSRPIISVDIQEYSRVLCSAVLKPVKARVSLSDICRNSKHFKRLYSAMKPLIEYEKLSISQSLLGNSELLCEVIEEGPIIGFELGLRNRESKLYKLKEEVNSRLSELGFLNTAGAVVSRYYGGLYFSYEQAVQIDSILEEIEKLSKEHRDFYLAILLSVSSDLVNTVGKQFAQPLRPRTSDGVAKTNLGYQVRKDRFQDAFNLYQGWEERYSNLEPPKYQCSVYKMDYADALNILDQNVRVVYADPPYTRDHYSRFYHVLETLCLRDNPKVSYTRIGGKLVLSRGVYRAERHQSPFCIKSLALNAFRVLFLRTKKLNCSLVLSYSPYNENKAAHPRVLTLDQIIKIAREYFKKIDVVYLDKFSHSKLNKTEKNFEKPEKSEALVVCR